MVDGVWITDPVTVKDAFFDFYSNKFERFNGVRPVRRSSHFKQLAPNMANELESGGDKAPGPDGYSFWFLKLEVVDFVQEFFTTKSFGRCCNSSFITLISKVTNPMFIKDYRSISLIVI